MLSFRSADPRRTFGQSWILLFVSPVRASRSFEIRPRWKEPDVKMERPVAKATFVRSQDCWKIFWMRADLKWHGYEPLPAVDSIEEFLVAVDKGEYGCFWG